MIPDAWQRRLRWGAIGAAAITLLSTPWWGPRLLANFDYFHVRRIEFDGLRYSDPSDLVARLALDTTASVWMPLEPLGERVRAHPMVVRAFVTRRLPSTLLFTVEERVPIALAPSDEGLAPVDSVGDLLPIDPTRTPVDVPIVAQADSTLLLLLARIRVGAPDLWARLASARRENATDFRLSFGEIDLRTRDDVTLTRLADILPVEADLARRRLQAVELDLRFRDQVIARLP